MELMELNLNILATWFIELQLENAEKVQFIRKSNSAECGSYGGFPWVHPSSNLDLVHGHIVVSKNPTEAKGKCTYFS